MATLACPQVLEIKILTDQGGILWTQNAALQMESSSAYQADEAAFAAQQESLKAEQKKSEEQAGEIQRKWDADNLAMRNAGIKRAEEEAKGAQQRHDAEMAKQVQGLKQSQDEMAECRRRGLAPWCDLNR